MRTNKALIIGFGSIGKKHLNSLVSINFFNKIDLVSNHCKDNKDINEIFKNIEDVRDLKSYNYFLICSETYLHFYHLSYLNKILNDKIIFCEKPIFHKFLKLENIKNKVFIGYQLRFHPVIKKLKEINNLDKIISSSIICGQYLPNWRETNYKNSYSSIKKRGGGVLLDLSHEIDYILWIFGTLKKTIGFQHKVSDLKIDSDDLTLINFLNKNNQVINLSLDYISKFKCRNIIAHTNLNSYKADLLDNKIDCFDINGEAKNIKIDSLQSKNLITEMHKSILYDTKKTIACNYKDAIEVMKVINKIQKQN